MIDTYVSIDVETTGLNAKWDKIIEVGAVKVVKGVMNETFSTFINPGLKIPDKVRELTGICDEDVKEAPSIETVIPKLIDFIGEYPWVGHSILFDYSFLKHAAINMGYSLEKEAVDTLKISRIVLCSLESRQLSSLCEYYDIEICAHRALEDARATAFLYQRLYNDFEESHKSLFVPHKLVYRVKKESKASEQQLVRLERLISLHHIECPYDINKMTKNEVSRYTDLILAEFGR